MESSKHVSTYVDQNLGMEVKVYAYDPTQENETHRYTMPIGSVLMGQWTLLVNSQCILGDAYRAYTGATST